MVDWTKLTDGADALFSDLSKFASLVSVLLKAWHTIAAANGGDIVKAGSVLEAHLTPGLENAPALAPEAKVKP